MAVLAAVEEKAQADAAEGVTAAVRASTAAAVAVACESMLQ